MNKPRYMYACVCDKCGRDFKSADAYRVICPKCTQLEGFKKPKSSSKKKVAKPSLEDKLKELKAYNAATGQRLTYGQYQAQHRTD